LETARVFEMIRVRYTKNNETGSLSATELILEDLQIGDVKPT